MKYEYEIPLPGMYIEEEIEARGWSQRDLAFILGIEEPALNKIIKGKTGISFEMSKMLAKAFGVDADFLPISKKAYDFARAKEPDPSVERRAMLQNVYPIREMIKRGWIGADNLEIQLTRFLGSIAPRRFPSSPMQQKKPTLAKMQCPPKSLGSIAFGRSLNLSLLAGIQSGRFATVCSASGSYNRARRDLDVPAILDECGVRFIVVEGLAGGKIDGVCFWLDRFSPVIGMSLRFDRIDNFWFVLRHEIEHVLRRHGTDQEVIDVNLDRATSQSQEEREANEAAADFVSQEKIDSFIVRKTPLISERDVLAFAKTVGVHPGLVVGQIQLKTDRWDFLKRHQVKIRHLISHTAIVDGWGDVAPVIL